MITDKIENWHLYKGIGQEIEKGFLCLQNKDLLTMEPGRYDIEGDDLYLQVRQYEIGLLEESPWETHGRYIDIRYIMKGFEVVGYTDASRLKLEKAYDPQKDIAYFSGDGDMITLREGYFILLFPGEAHKNYFIRQNQQEDGYVKKAVAKILLRR